MSIFPGLAAIALVMPAVGRPSQTAPIASRQIVHPEAREHSDQAVLIVSYVPENGNARRKVLAFTKRSKLKVVYDMPRMSTIVVGGVAEASVERQIAAYLAIAGVTSARRSETYELYGGKSIQ